MLFLTKQNLYVNINNIKTIDPILEEGKHLVTLIDGEELLFSDESGLELIRLMGVKNG